jgi:DNA integrity scanning protein DisA with diadenylate cyclase activity
MFRGTLVFGKIIKLLNGKTGIVSGKFIFIINIILVYLCYFFNLTIIKMPIDKTAK